MSSRVVVLLVGEGADGERGCEVVVQKVGIEAEVTGIQSGCYTRGKFVDGVFLGLFEGVTVIAGGGEGCRKGIRTVERAVGWFVRDEGFERDPGGGAEPEGDAPGEVVLVGGGVGDDAPGGFLVVDGGGFSGGVAAPCHEALSPLQFIVTNEQEVYHASGSVGQVGGEEVETGRLVAGEVGFTGIIFQGDGHLPTRGKV